MEDRMEEAADWKGFSGRWPHSTFGTPGLYTVAPPGDKSRNDGDLPPMEINPMEINKDALQETLRAIQDRIPAPKRVLMNTRMAESFQRSLDVVHARWIEEQRLKLRPPLGPGATIQVWLGVEIYINDDLPSGSWMEWHGGRWWPRGLLDGPAEASRENP